MDIYTEWDIIGHDVNTLKMWFKDDVQVVYTKVSLFLLRHGGNRGVSKRYNGLRPIKFEIVYKNNVYKEIADTYLARVFEFALHPTVDRTKNIVIKRIANPNTFCRVEFT